MSDEHRLVLFVDLQNAYKGARETFFNEPAFHTLGQFHPDRLGQAIASREVTRTKRRVAEVRVYTGRPSSSKHPRAYGPHMRQCAAWEKKGVVVRPRPLRYPRSWPQAGKPEEKGIDVELAIDFVMMRLRNEYDVGVLMSSDTDLVPALEAACQLAETDNKPLPEVAAWGEPKSGRSRLRVKGTTEIRCHWLDFKAYNAVKDPTDYNIKPQALPEAGR